MTSKKVNDTFQELEISADLAAKRLLGCHLLCEVDGVQVCVRIVETEAYDQSDAASHSYKGRTPRTDVMFGPAGCLYVYFTYGMHYCMNVVTGRKGEGSAVLIRAVEPIEGEEALKTRRGDKTGVALTNGPAKLCQALGIDGSMNGHNLAKPPLTLVLHPMLEDAEIISTTRIGVTRAKEVLRRFYIKNNEYISQLK